MKSVGLSETAVVMSRFDLRKMCKAVEEFRVTGVVAAPPVMVTMIKEDLTDGFDLQSLETVGSSGASLEKDVIGAFNVKFPYVILFQVAPYKKIRRGG